MITIAGAIALSALATAITAPPALDADGIRREILAAWPVARACHAAERAKGPVSTGTIVLRFRSEKSGVVWLTEVLSSTVTPKGLATCLMTEMKKVKFPASKGKKEFRVTFPFVIGETGPDEAAAAKAKIELVETALAAPTDGLSGGVLGIKGSPGDGTGGLGSVLSGTSEGATPTGPCLAGKPPGPSVEALGVDTHGLRDGVCPRLGKILTCYLKERKLVPALSGRMVLDLVVDRTGPIVGVEIRSSTLKRPALHACASEAARTFLGRPHTDTRRVVSTITLVFRPAS